VARPGALAPQLLRGFGGALLLGLAAVTGLAGCGDDERPDAIGSPPQIPSKRLPETTQAFEETECPSGVPTSHATQCGWVSVPEDHAAPSGAALKLFVLRVFSDADGVKDDPIVYLEGGPGGSGVATVSALFDYFEPLLAHRDLVTFDQRGAGDSLPSLACDELRGTEAALDSDLSPRVAACRTRLTEDGVDPSKYTSAQNALDVDDVRGALGYESWNLLGVSYGTRLALTVMRDAPAGVRSVVLDSTVPLEVDLLAETAPNAYADFERLFEACRQDADCAAAYPDLMGTMLGIVDRLNADPIPSKFSDGTSYQLTGADVLGVLFTFLYAWENLPYIPRLIHEIDAGDYSLILKFIEESWAGGYSEGMYLSINCSEEAAFTSAEALQSAAVGLPAAFAECFASPAVFDQCVAWDVPASPALENEAVHSSLPTLVLAGYYDPITPPSFGQLVASALPRSQYLELGGAAHGAMTTPCGLELIDRYFEAPTVPVDGACAGQQQLPSFVLSSLVAPSSALAVGSQPPPSLRFSLPGDSAPDPEKLLKALRASQLLAGGKSRW